MTHGPTKHSNCSNLSPFSEVLFIRGISFDAILVALGGMLLDIYMDAE